MNEPNVSRPMDAFGSPENPAARLEPGGIFFSQRRRTIIVSEDVLPPILFNAHKHHAGFLRARIVRAVHAGPNTLTELADELLVVGTKLMDFYHGPFSPSEIGTKIMGELARAGRDQPESLQGWLDAAEGYRVLDFPEDTSRWVVRMGQEERFVHVHPARNSPFTVRVRASSLRTSVLALVHAKIHGGEPLSRIVVNAVRTKYLNLAPIGRDPSGDDGMGAIIELLR